LYCKTPSGTCNTPDNLTTTGATEGAVTGLTGANWTVTAGTNGLVIYHAQTPENVSAGTVMSLGFGSIINSQIDDCQPGNDASTDTCYVRITTYANDAASTIVDTTIVSYTIISAVTVSARVDPTFTFVVGGVAANQVRSDITSSVASTYNTLPFGNLTAGTPKYATHQLNVTTNTQGGYTVSARVATPLTGVYTSNNIDPFIGAWSAPTTWTEPTGSTPNDNTGWFWS
jgi:hypothetical protein